MAPTIKEFTFIQFPNLETHTLMLILPITNSPCTKTLKLTGITILIPIPKSSSQVLHLQLLVNLWHWLTLLVRLTQYQQIHKEISLSHTLIRVENIISTTMVFLCILTNQTFRQMMVRPVHYGVLWTLSKICLPNVKEVCLNENQALISIYFLFYLQLL